jgi:prepilin-type processing-associated H-X9-DG protein
MNDDNFSFTSLLIIVFVVGAIASLIIPSMGHSRPYYQTKRCVNNMKQIGLGMHMYFSDGTEKNMPMAYGTIRKSNTNSWNDLFELDESTLECPAKRIGRKKTYAIHSDAADGVLFSTIEHADSAVAGDTTVHKNGRKANILYGDGHVAPFRLPIGQIDNNPQINY